VRIVALESLLKRVEAVEKSVCCTDDGEVRRWYWRFRGGRWYGGIATGDVVGCILRCGFCWAWRYAWSTRGRYLLSAREAFEKLYSIARSRSYERVRLSGGEPTLCFDHLVELIELCVSRRLSFVLETNGLLIGLDRRFARELARFGGRGIEVRVSIKGCSPREFSMLTLGEEGWWWLQLEALRNLLSEGLEACEEVYPAIMLSFSDKESQQFLLERLREIDERLAKCIDPEYVFLYPHVVELMKKRGLRPRIAYRPNEIPEELV